MDTEEYHIGTSESALFLCQEKQRKKRTCFTITKLSELESWYTGDIYVVDGIIRLWLYKSCSPGRKDLRRYFLDDS